MEQRIKITPDETVRAIVKACYPEYRGRKYSLVAQEYPLNVRDSWEGGSRTYYKFYNLTTHAIAEMPAQSAFDSEVKGADRVTLPDGIICVAHVIFCGKDLGIRIYVNPINLPKLLKQ